MAPCKKESKENTASIFTGEHLDLQRPQQLNGEYAKRRSSQTDKGIDLQTLEQLFPNKIATKTELRHE
jgi:hypothetical protein